MTSRALIEFVIKCGAQEQYQNIEQEFLLSEGIRRAKYMHLSEDNLRRTGTALERHGLEELVKYNKNDETGDFCIWFELVNKQTRELKAKSRILKLSFPKGEEDGAGGIEETENVGADDVSQEEVDGQAPEAEG